MTKYYVDAEGSYIGGFDGAEPPAGAIEVPDAPGHAAQIWDGEMFLALPPIVPSQVSPAQAEIALYNYNNGVLLGQVNTLIDTYPYEPVRIWWRKATYISRYHPYLEAVAIEMGLSDETVDELFSAAALL